MFKSIGAIRSQQNMMQCILDWLFRAKTADMAHWHGIVLVLQRLDVDH